MKSSQILSSYIHQTIHITNYNEIFFNLGHNQQQPLIQHKTPFK